MKTLALTHEVSGPNANDFDSTIGGFDSPNDFCFTNDDLRFDQQRQHVSGFLNMNNQLPFDYPLISPSRCRSDQALSGT